MGAIAPRAVIVGAANGGERDHPSASDPVREHGQREHQHDPSSHHRPGRADAGVADPEVVGGEVDGLCEEGVDERRRHRRRGEKAEHPKLAGVEMIRRSPGGCGRRVRVVVDGRVEPSGHRPPDREEEQPGEPRQGPAESRPLIPSPVDALDSSLVVEERSIGLDEGARSITWSLEEEIGARPRQMTGNHRRVRPRPLHGVGSTRGVRSTIHGVLPAT